LVVWQSTTKPGEQRAEIFAGLLIGGVRPEEESELLPRDRSSTMQHEISRHLLEARLVKACDRLVVLKQAKQAQQVEMQTRGWHPFASVRGLGAQFYVERRRCPL
jgi:hypothetical protein